MNDTALRLSLELAAAITAEAKAREWVMRCADLLETARNDLNLRERLVADLRSRGKP